MKKGNKNLVIGIILLVIVLGALFILRIQEDGWVKDSRGVYVMHGNPSEIPDYVLQQQEIISCALSKFETVDGDIYSQCLGTCEDYSVDIVHSLRTDEDNLEENQCEEYLNGITGYLIELDREGNVVRII